MLKSSLRTLYRALPLKRSILEAIRRTPMASMIPKSIKRFLVFSAPFHVQTPYGHFRMLNGYGRDIESIIFWEGVNAFESTTTTWWFKLAKRSTYIFDIGANTGIYSMMAQMCNQQAKIHAFEPLKRVYSILEDNSHLNASPAGSVATHRLALSDYTGSGDMFDLPVEHMYTASLNRNVHAERGQMMSAIQESVSVMRLDDFLQQQGIEGLDLIKIDVESHEPAVLRGMGDSLQKYHPSLIVEIWNNDVGAAVEAALTHCSYLYFALDKAQPKLTQHICNEDPDQGYINYLVCTHEVAAELELI